ncbi:MAG: hypothetical protein AAF456_17395 [Planctomycetota bacterium]
MKKTGFMLLAALSMTMAAQSTASAQVGGFTTTSNIFDYLAFITETDVAAGDDSVVIFSRQRFNVPCTFMISRDPIPLPVWAGNVWGIPVWWPQNSAGLPDANYSGDHANTSYNPYYFNGKWNNTGAFWDVLQPDTTYYYAVLPWSRNQSAVRGSFTTRE